MKITNIVIVCCFLCISTKHISVEKRDVFDIIPNITRVIENNENTPECVCGTQMTCSRSCEESQNRERGATMQRRRKLRKLFVKWLNRSQEKKK